MPIYEYRCSACGHELEVLQKLSEAPLSTCPECGKPKLTKLVSAAGFQLKGSGWYATDFKSSGTRAAFKPEHAKEAESKGTDAKGDTKNGGATETAGAKSASTTAPAADAAK